MKLRKYKSYEDYKQSQVEANKRKIHAVYVTQPVIDEVCDFLEANKATFDFGLCHGTRRGEEQKMFKKRLKCKVLGTEISDTAKDFPNTIEWDFHEIKSEWVNSCDFIFSNSLDHAMDPEKALTNWLSCLNSDGIMALEIAETHKSRPKKAKRSDPFAASHAEVRDMIEDVGGKVLSISRLKNYRHVAYLIYAVKN
jgi:hypothetical protein